MDYISEQLLTSKLILEPSDITSNIENVIKTKLKDKIEGKCSTNGYIIEDSTKIIKRNMGEVKTNNGKSEIRYLITYKAKVINLTEGDNIEIYVNNINKMGILGYVKLSIKDIETSENSPIIVMIPKEYFNNSSYNFNDITIGQQLNVIILGSRDKFLSDKIQCVARPS